MSNSIPKIQIIGISGIPLIRAEDDLGKIICDTAEKQGSPLLDNDILIVAQKIVSKAEGRIYRLKDITPSYFARNVARISGKEPELVELILRESNSIVRMSNGHLITETKHGWVCANSGVDKSNISGGDSVSLLPIDSDVSASRIRKRIKEVSGKEVAVIVTDTSGRPWRIGHIDLAIGSSGIEATLNLRGKKDLFNYVLKVKKTAIIDELASAAELVIGNAAEKISAAIIRGYPYPFSETAKATDLIMPKEKNLFP
jgi:coenzyme F420-0:L-glutamate ligase/coenzyme F420-1:gamma-L-glutamate ligase